MFPVPKCFQSQFHLLPHVRSNRKTNRRTCAGLVSFACDMQRLVSPLEPRNCLPASGAPSLSSLGSAVHEDTFAQHAIPSIITNIIRKRSQVFGKRGSREPRRLPDWEFVVVVVADGRGVIGHLNAGDFMLWFLGEKTTPHQPFLRLTGRMLIQRTEGQTSCCPLDSR